MAYRISACSCLFLLQPLILVPSEPFPIQIARTRTSMSCTRFGFKPRALSHRLPCRCCSFPLPYIRNNRLRTVSSSRIVTCVMLVFQASKWYRDPVVPDEPMTVAPIDDFPASSHMPRESGVQRVSFDFEPNRLGKSSWTSVLWWCSGNGVISPSRHPDYSVCYTAFERFLPASYRLLVDPFVGCKSGVEVMLRAGRHGHLITLLYEVKQSGMTTSGI